MADCMHVQSVALKTKWLLEMLVAVENNYSTAVCTQHDELVRLICIERAANQCRAQSICLHWCPAKLQWSIRQRPAATVDPFARWMLCAVQVLVGAQLAMEIERKGASAKRVREQIDAITRRQQHAEQFANHELAKRLQVEHELVEVHTALAAAKQAALRAAEECASLQHAVKVSNRVRPLADVVSCWVASMRNGTAREHDLLHAYPHAPNHVSL